MIIDVHKGLGKLSYATTHYYTTVTACVLVDCGGRMKILLLIPSPNNHASSLAFLYAESLKAWMRGLLLG